MDKELIIESFLVEKSNKEEELAHVVESLFWDEELGQYTAEKNDYCNE